MYMYTYRYMYMYMYMYRYMHMHAYNYISSSIFYSNSLASGHLHHGGTASDHTKASSWTRGVPRKLTSKITGKWMLCSSTCVLCWCIIYILLCNVYCAMYIVYIYIYINIGFSSICVTLQSINGMNMYEMLKHSCGGDE